MGLTNKLGQLSQSIQQDASNNIGIGGAVNASYKLTVTGTTLTTGAATFSSSVTANSGIIDTGGFNIKGTGAVAKPSMLRLSNASDAAYYWDIWRDNTTGYLNFGGATGGSVSTFLTIKDVSGNVGIGTGNPTSNLEIFDNTNSGVITLSRDNGQQRGVVRWGRNNGGTFQNTASIVGDSDTTSINNGILTFWTSNASGTLTERIRITGDGDVLIGRSSNYTGYNDSHVIEKDSGAYALMVRNSNTGNCSTAQFSLAGDPNNTSSYFLICRGGDTAAGANRLLIYGNGNVQNANGSYGTISSDRRLKENIIDATSKLEDIMKLRVVNFNLIDNEEKHIGFIAQEMQEVFPSFVYQTDTRQYDEDGNVVKGLEDALGLKVGMEFAVLVKAIQELSAKVTALENR